MSRSTRLAALALASTLAALGCAVHPPPRTTAPLACERADLDPSPIWTASASWSDDEERLIVLDPRGKNLLVYSRGGELERRVELAPLADLDTASPVRLVPTDGGYLLGDQKQLLWLDTAFGLVRRSEPFAAFADLEDGSLNDFVVDGSTLFGYLDYADVDPAAGDEDEAPEKTAGGDDLPGPDKPFLWHRGFYRLDLGKARLERILELPFDDGEYTAYYDYHRRPYVAELGGRVYVLRFTEPARIERLVRRRLEPLATLPMDGLEPVSIHAWEGRLYVLAHEEPVLVAPAGFEDAQPQGGPSQAQLLHARAIADGAEHTWFLFEVDQRSGRLLARYRLPTTSPRVVLVPGRDAWAIVEDALAPNVHDGETSSVLFVSPEPLRSRRSAAGDEVVLECAGP